MAQGNDVIPLCVSGGINKKKEENCLGFCILKSTRRKKRFASR